MSDRRSGAATGLAAALADRYRIERELGHGGMATVYLARDLKHDRDVALKVLNPELAQSVGFERFQREIRLAARLQHPHVLSVFDSGDTGAGQLWFTMPFVDGESLRDRLRREGQLPLDDALRITREAAQALQYAHEQGVVHRDIKPENLLLTKDGSTLVADFGVARALAAGEALTQTGLAVGTPAYMSPEQATGDVGLDARTDIYSLGCVLYEMLSGEPPFTGPNAQAIIAKRFNATPTPLRVVRPEVPEAVAVAVSRALARTPADRFATAADMRRALASEATTPAATPTQVVATPAGRLMSRRVAALLGGIAVLGTMSLVAFWVRPGSPPRALSIRQLTYTGTASWPALSPDGRSVAYISGTRALMVQHLDGGDPVVLVPPVRFAAWPRWSADGSTILVIMFRDSLELAGTYAVPSSGGAARKVLDDQLPFDTETDSTLLVRIPRERHRVEVIDWTSGRVVRTRSLPAEVDDGFASGTSSPDGRWFAIQAFGAVWTLSTEATGAPNKLMVGTSPHWTSGSDAVYVLAGDPGAEALFRASIDQRTGKLRQAPARVASLPGASGFDVRNGRLVYSLAAASQQARALVVDPRTKAVVSDRIVSLGSAPVTEIALSLDGRTIAFSQTRSGDQNIYALPFDGTPRPIATSPADEFAPALAPDGQRLAYIRQDSMGSAVVVTDLAGGAVQRVGSLPTATTIPALGSVNRPRWSADGRYLAYPGIDQRRLALIDLAQGTEQVLSIPDSAGAGYGEVVPAPNGSGVVASTLRRWTDWGEVWAGTAAGNSWHRARTPFGENHPLAWSADGWLYLENHRAISTDYGAVRVELWRTRGVDGVPSLIAPLPEGCMQADVAADGRRVACVTHRTESDLYLGTDFDLEAMHP